jgi:hypothetical protein
MRVLVAASVGLRRPPLRFVCCVWTFVLAHLWPWLVGGLLVPGSSRCGTAGSLIHAEMCSVEPGGAAWWCLPYVPMASRAVWLVLWERLYIRAGGTVASCE